MSQAPEHLPEEPDTQKIEIQLPPSYPPSTTHTFEPEGITRAREQHRSKRVIAVDQTSGVRYLYILTCQCTRWHLLRSRRTWEDSLLTLRLPASNGVWVNPKLLLRDDFMPSDTERQVLVYRRLHWWQWGKRATQMILLIVAIAIGLMAPDQLQDVDVRLRWAVVLIASIVALVIVFVELFRWFYTYLGLTDRRIVLIYRPPFNLPGTGHPIDLKDLRGFEPQDATIIQNFLRCGTVIGETAASHMDSWLRRGLRFLPHHWELAQMVASAKHRL